MELNTVLEQMTELKIRIDDILRSSTYDEHADLRGLHVDRKDSDQIFLGKAWRLPNKDADVGGMLALCVEEEKTEIRCMMTWRAKPERHHAASRYVAGS